MSSPFVFQSVSSKGQPKQPKDFRPVTVPPAEDQTLSDPTREYDRTLTLLCLNMAFTCARLSPQVDDEGELFYSLDDGHTKFSDLIQLVEFYQLNRGVLPCKLRHHCARIAL